MKKQNIILLAILLICLAVAGGMALSMAQRTAKELLWGYRPLGLFLGAWGTWVAIRQLIRANIQKKPIEWRWLGLSYLGGGILALGFPDLIPMPLLMFVGFVPLLIVEDEIAQKFKKGSGRTLFPYAYHCFIFWNILTTYWVTNTALIAGVFAIMVNSLLMCIPRNPFPSYPQKDTPDGIRCIYCLLDHLRIHSPQLGHELALAYSWQ